MISLRKKLAFSYGMLILIIFSVSAWGIYHFLQLGRAIDVILVNNYKSILAAENMKEALERLDSAALFYVAGHAEKSRKQFSQNSEKFLQQFAIASNNITEKGESEIIEDIRSNFSAYDKEVAGLLSSKNARPQDEASRIYFDRLEPAFLQLKTRLDDVLKLNQQAMLSAKARAQMQSRRAQISTLVLGACAILVALLFAGNFTNYVVRPISALAQNARKIGEGDFEQYIDIHSKDEIGVLAAEFSRMATRLRDLRKSDYWQLMLERKKADATIDALNEPVVVTDAQGRVVKLNHAAQRLIDSQENPEVRFGLSLGTLRAGERILQAVQSAVAMQKTVAQDKEAPVITVRTGETERSYRLRTTPMRDEEGRLIGAVTLLVDVYAMGEVDRLKSEFISVASGKLREPLRSLQLSLHGVIEGFAGDLNSKQKELLSYAREDAMQLEEIMKDLLELTEIQSGVRILRKEPLRPIDLAREAVERHLAAAESKHLKLENQIWPDLPRVDADRAAVGRVFDNLLSNAIRHTDRDGRVILSAEERDRSVFFSVSDTGEGIPPESLPNLFDGFIEGGKSAGRTGLGLPIVKQLIAAHGGQIQAQSSSGEGSTFSFTLPLFDWKAGSEKVLVK
jgi:NtrC-family two-component system sensor histidine kinase KinB